jgi:long-chain acyl-CoA synthetase
VGDAGTLAEVVDARWRRWADRLAVRDPASGDLTYGELLAWSERASRALEAWVVDPGQRVALYLPNSAAYVAAWFAAARIGAVVAPLNPLYRARELADHLADLEPAAVITDAEHLPALLDVVAAPGAERALGVEPALVELERDRRVRTVRGGRGRGAVVPAAGSPPLLQQYTSGSTGSPKRVIRSHAALVAELTALADVFDVDEDDRFLGAAPFSHVNGLVRTMLTSMWVGARLYPVREFHRRAVLDLLTTERLTFFGGVPQMFAILARTPGRGPVDLSALRVAFSSSAPLLVEDSRLFTERYGVVIRQLYGSTETGTIAFNRGPGPESARASVGTPLPGVQVSVVTENGAAAAPGAEGELIVQSPFAAAGYFDNPTATRESFRDGWYVTGDLGFCDAEGRITLTARKKLIINRAGFKVNPYEVEAVIRSHPRVNDAVVFPRPGPHGDDVVCCAVVASGPCTAEDIVLHCRERMAEFKVPSRVEFRPSLPKSATGKILRGEL